jgi:hypothetical protein
LEGKEKDSFEVRKKLMMLHTLLMSMGKKFKVLIQQKGFEQSISFRLTILSATHLNYRSLLCATIAA